MTFKELVETWYPQALEIYRVTKEQELKMLGMRMGIPDGSS